MMRNFLVVLFALLALTGCRSLVFRGIYQYDFVGVADYNLKDTVAVSEGVYEDSLVKVQWYVDGHILHFQLENLSDENIEIDWRKVSFISPGGTLTRSVIDENSFIPPKTSLSKVMRWQRFTPVALLNVPRLRYKYTIWGTWKIVEIRATHDIEVRDAWKEILGTPFGVYLPMTVKGKERNYRFLFEVSRLRVWQQKPDAYYEVGKGEDFPEGYRTLEEIKETKKKNKRKNR